MSPTHREPLARFRSFGYFDGLLGRPCTPEDGWDELEKETYLKGYTLGWEERDRTEPVPNYSTLTAEERSTLGTVHMPRRPEIVAHTSKAWERPQPNR